MKLAPSHSYFVVTSVHPGLAETVILDVRKMLTYIAIEFTHENSINGEKAWSTYCKSAWQAK